MGQNRVSYVFEKNEVQKLKVFFVFSFFPQFQDLFMRLRATLWNAIRTNLDMFESAFRYGLIPMKQPPSPPSELEIVVNFIIEKPMLKQGGDLVNQVRIYH